MLQIQRILAPVDFSEHASCALTYAREMAATYDARLDVLHVIEEPTFPAMYSSLMHELYGELPDVNQEALRALQALLARAGGPDVETGLHVEKGDAARRILEGIETLNADLVVMSSHGLTGLQHLVLGSVAEKVVRLATCPVLVVKAFGKSLLPAKKRTPAPAEPPQD